MNDSDKTKEQLIQEIELLRTLIDTLPDRLYVKDAKSRFVICNKAVAQDSDLHFSGDPIGKNDFDLFEHKMARDFHAAEQEIIKTGKPMMNEEVHRTRRKDGQENWSLCTKLPWRDKNGNIIGIIGANRDITERKRAELALLESETRYKAIFESAREGIIVGIIETRQFIYANPAICKMFGYTAEELTCLTVSDIHPKEYLQYASDRFKTFAQGEATFTQSIPCIRKNGTVFYADISATRIVINDKDCFVGFFTDSTERKHAEDALRESEARYKAIFDHATEGIIIADIETKRFKYANQAACGMFGYTAEKLQQMAVYDIHPKEYMPSVLARFEVLARGEKTFAPNVPCLSKDGTVFYANINSTCVVIDQKPCNVGLFTDITERKHTEDALRESEARYKAIFNYATEGIVVTDIETKQHRYANPAFCRMFGYTAEQLQQMAVYDIHPKESMPSVIAGFEAQARGEKTLVPNVPCLHKNGTVFYADIDTTCVVIDQRPCNVGLFTDITERKHTEDALRESEARYKAIFNYATEGIIVADIETKRFNYANQAACEMFGCTAEQLQQMTVYDAHPKEYMPYVIAGFKAQARGEKTLLPDVPCLRKDGTVFYANINTTRVIIDQRPCNVGLFTDITEHIKAEEQLKKVHEELEIRVKKRTADLAKAVEKLKKEITERKRAEESLRSAEVRFRSIFENTVIGLYRTTPSGRILLANPALIKMMGCRSFKQLAKFNVEKNGFDPSTPRSRFKKIIKKEGRVIGLESIWRRTDGTKLFVSESAFAVKDAKGKIIYYEGTAQDITKRKEAEAKLMLYQQQLRSLASELSLAEERLRRRIAAELHDHIAQNLAISKIKLESLTGDAEPGLAKSLNEVNGLISQTIEASRSLTFEISPPVLYELGFEAAVNWLAKQTRQRFGLDVEFADDGKPKPLNTDIRVLLFQAVRELLVNVVKHARAKKVKVVTCRIQKNIQITVEDNGVGFDVEAISAVNDPSKGGFGLFNIRERLDHIGGSVIINTKAGKGTQITLTAPVEKQEKPRARFAGTRPDKNRKRRKKKE